MLRINRPAKTGAAALEALNAPLKVLGTLFGQRQESEVDTKATLDRISQITQVAPSLRLAPCVSCECSLRLSLSVRFCQTIFFACARVSVSMCVYVRESESNGLCSRSI